MSGLDEKAEGYLERAWKRLDTSWWGLLPVWILFVALSCAGLLLLREFRDCPDSLFLALPFTVCSLAIGSSITVILELVWRYRKWSALGRGSVNVVSSLSGAPGPSGSAPQRHVGDSEPRLALSFAFDYIHDEDAWRLALRVPNYPEDDGPYTADGTVCVLDEWGEQVEQTVRKVRCEEFLRELMRYPPPCPVSAHLTVYIKGASGDEHHKIVAEFDLTGKPADLRLRASQSEAPRDAQKALQTVAAKLLDLPTVKRSSG